MALTISPPRPPRVAGCGPRGVFARLLAVVLTTLAFAPLLCGAAMAAQIPAGMASDRPAAPQVSMAGHGISTAGMDGRAACEDCARENGGHCGSGLPAGIHDGSAHSGPCAAPAPGQMAAAAAPGRAATAAVRGSPASRPPDLHRLQVLRI
ncbi:hypothetical protein ABZ078_42290 [Streptomyces sp. NPDC006385]|uniref:hypothetical protein n=1 Tax=Streptomyces sp. NPDC006385 TaxID=3156761 RepID=UPI0033BD58AE